MRLNATRLGSIASSRSFGDQLDDLAGQVPGLDLNFAQNKSLIDDYSGTTLVTFTRASTGTFVGSNGLIQSATTNEPRFDHNPTTGESLGLLVEEARTNLLLNSATLSTQMVTVAAAANTLSFYGTGTVTLTGVSTAGPLVGTGANNRVSLTFTPTVGVLILTVSGSVTNAQLEAGAFPTSYIPTTSATVTRAADVASITGANFSSFYNQTEGTLFADVNSAPVNTIAQLSFDFSDNSTSERIFQRRSGAGTIATAVVDNNVTQSDIGNVSIAASARYKSGFAYRLNDLASVTNGGGAVTDTSATLPTPDRLYIGQSYTSAQVCNGTINRLTFWPTRLSNEVLQRITQP
jgi:hypothetical protein